MTAIQIYNIWTDMENTRCMSVPGSKWSFWGRGTALQFCELICINLVSRAIHNTLDKANGKSPNTAVVWINLSGWAWPRGWAVYTNFTITKFCRVTRIWFEGQRLWCGISAGMGVQSKWEVSMHKSPLFSFAVCLFSSVVSCYSATLPYIVKVFHCRSRLQGSLWQH